MYLRSGDYTIYKYARYVKCNTNVIQARVGSQLQILSKQTVNYSRNLQYSTKKSY